MRAIQMTPVLLVPG